MKIPLIQLKSLISRTSRISFLIFKSFLTISFLVEWSAIILSRFPRRALNRFDSLSEAGGIRFAKLITPFRSVYSELVSWGHTPRRRRKNFQNSVEIFQFFLIGVRLPN